MLSYLAASGTYSSKQTKPEIFLENCNINKCISVIFELCVLWLYYRDYQGLLSLSPLKSLYFSGFFNHMSVAHLYLFFGRLLSLLFMAVIWVFFQIRGVSKIDKITQ